MSHNQPRSNWLVEGGIALGGGMVYGWTYVLCSHPLDTIKTKMQAQAGFEQSGVWQTLTKTLRTQGVVGLYRGCVPLLWGSAVYRSAQFAGFEATYTYLNNPSWKKEIPLTAGLQIRVVIGGLVGGTARALIECPLEYAKVKRQTNQSWQLRKVYTGFQSLALRSSLLQACFFSIIDSMRRNCPNWFTYPVVGPFVTSGFAAVIAWAVVWPLEYIRTQLQAGYDVSDRSLWARLRHLAANGGMKGLYRGVGPGLLLHFVGCGTGMLAFQFSQRKATEWGLRGRLTAKTSS